MPNQSLGVQVAVLHEQVKELQDMRGDVKTILTGVSDIKVQLATLPTFDKLRPLYESVQTLKEKRAESKGAWKVITGISACSGVIGGLITKLWPSAAPHVHAADSTLAKKNGHCQRQSLSENRRAPGDLQQSVHVRLRLSVRVSALSVWLSGKYSAAGGFGHGCRSQFERRRNFSHSRSAGPYSVLRAQQAPSILETIIWVILKNNFSVVATMTATAGPAPAAPVSRSNRYPQSLPISSKLFSAR